ncbi:hypothetical protein JTB14_028277 [Gonioctena quinquepunctata]|nr:hypothetical protein JTB14_028277 [Gonioctena quinquepunctata]
MDIFICKCRSILALLPTGTLTEETQIDMVYGSLNVKSEKKCQEIKSQLSLISSLELASRRRLLWTLSQIRSTLRTPKPVASTSSSTGLICYGCKRPGVIRSNCPSCKSTSASSIDFSSAEISTKVPNKNIIAELPPRSRPLLKVNILGFDGIGILDTAAKQSIAGPSLFRILQETNQTVTSKTVIMKLADGCSKTENILLAKVDVLLQGRIIPTTFVIIPGAKNCTLLGIDFIIDAKIRSNVADRMWNFSDNEAQYELEFEPETPTSDLHITSFETLRPEVGLMLDEEQRLRLLNCLDVNSDIFEKTGEPTPYAEHSINTGDHPPISLPPYRMFSARKEQL